MNRQTFPKVGFLLLFFVLASGVHSQSSGNSEQVSMSPGQEKLFALGFDIPRNPIEAPDFSLKTLDNKEASLKKASGKLVLLNIWATWCGPCRAEMPSMQALYDTFKNRGFEMYAVAAPHPPQETLEGIKEYIAEGGYTFPVPIDKDFFVNSTYGSGSIPTTWLIGPDGIIIGRLVGAVDWMTEEVVEALELLLP